MSLLPQSQNLRLLVVEDNDAKRYALKRTLSLMPEVEVLEAKTGEEALELAVGRPDLVILDPGLPDISGFELCRRLKSAPLTAAVPILMVSSQFTESNHRVEGISSGADGYLDFSGDSEEFRLTVATWLRNRGQAVKAQRSADHVARLYSLTTSLAAASTLAEVASLILDKGLEMLGAQAGALLTAASDGWLDIAGQRGAAPLGTSPSLRMHTSTENPATRAFFEGKAIFASGTEACAELFPVGEARDGLRRQGAQALVCVPLKGRNVPLGVLCFTFSAPQPFEPRERQFIQALGEQCSLALDRAELLRQAQDSVSFQQRLLGVLAHDLRTPLMAMLLQTDLLRRAGDLSPKQLGQLGKLTSSGQRMSRIISDLLDYSRIQSGGGVPLHLAPTTLHDVCRTPLDEVEATYPGRRVAYDVEGEGEGVWDVSRLQQVVSNLLNNALQYSSPDSTVRLSWREIPARVRLEVWNEGVPIPPDVQERLFQPFERGRAVGGTASRNLGLGLFIVREVVRAHGGTVEVASSERGTRFIVELPKVTQR